MVLKIEIPKEKESEVIKVLKALGVKISKRSKTPNQETIKAIGDARTGKTRQIEDMNSFMDNL